MIIDAKDVIVGRLGSFVAKKALLGEKVDIINCENAVISGNKKVVFSKYKHKDELGGPHWGPFLPKRADMFIKRIIRGMIDYKTPTGKKAFERIKCYIGVPNQFENQNIISLDNIKKSKLPNMKYVTINELTEYLKHKEK